MTQSEDPVLAKPTALEQSTLVTEPSESVVTAATVDAPTEAAAVDISSATAKTETGLPISPPVPSPGLADEVKSKSEEVKTEETKQEEAKLEETKPEEVSAPAVESVAEPVVPEPVAAPVAAPAVSEPATSVAVPSSEPEKSEPEKVSEQTAPPVAPPAEEKNDESKAAEPEAATSISEPVKAELEATAVPPPDADVSMVDEPALPETVPEVVPASAPEVVAEAKPEVTQPSTEPVAQETQTTPAVSTEVTTEVKPEVTTAIPAATAEQTSTTPVAADSTTAATSTPAPAAPATEQKVEDVAYAPVLPPGDYDPPADAPKGLAKHQLKYASSVLRAVKRLKDASAFVAPVDPVKLNIPTYFDIIKQPMDLGTMDKKLNAGEYDSVSSFVADFELIVSNCLTFNGSESFVSNMARNVKSSFIKHMAHMPYYNQVEQPKAPAKKKSFVASENGGTPKSQRAAAQAANAVLSGDGNQSFALQPSGVPTIRRDSSVTETGRPKREIHPPKPRDLPYGDVKPRKKKYATELKFCGQVLKELLNRKHEAYSFPFLQPVDPVALNCPSYFKIIKEPMDLSTIQEKYNNNQYETADEFVADVRLMFRNCYKFNPEGSPVNIMGHRFEAVFDKKWSEKPVPATSPPAHQSIYEESDSEDYEEAGITNPAISFLEEQIERMTAELMKLKKEALREHRDQQKKPTPSRKRRATNGGAAKRDKPRKERKSTLSGLSNGPQHVTYEMKVKMSEMIGTLPERKLRHVVQIVQESMPQLKNSGEEEIELDLEKVDPDTLLKLYNFIVLDTVEKKRPSVAADRESIGPKRRKSKPLTEDEQTREIESIQNKLKQFDSIKPGASEKSTGGADTSRAVGNSGAVSDSESDEDDDDDDDSSSSEEE